MIKKYENYFKNHYKLNFSSEDYDLSYKWLLPQWRLIKSHVEFNESKKILEVGSGFGGFYNLIQKNSNNNHYIGLEVDSAAASFANKYFKTNIFINKELEKFTTKQKFDIILAFEVLEHLDNPFTAIEKIRSMLDNNGVFVGTSPFPFPKNIWADETHRYVLHPENWKKIFKDVGFKHVEVYPMSFIPYIWRFGAKFNLRLPVYIPLKNMISTSLIIAKK